MDTVKTKTNSRASAVRRPKIAIFDYIVRPDNAMGGCHLRMLAGLCDRYDFTVFAVEFENPDPARIQYVHIPSPTRPTIALLLIYHLLAPLYYLNFRVRHRVSFDLVEKMEVFTFLGNLAYLHFCYRAYLENHWKQSRQPGLRGLLLSFDHAARAYLLEPLIYRLARTLIVPSRGLGRELARAYPFTRTKLRLLPNPVDFGRLSQASEFDRIAFRENLGFAACDLVIAFVALGQFERKGLPVLMDALATVKNENIKLLVVGGSEHWIEQYAHRAKQLGIRRRLHFAGMQRDIAPFLWASDAFCLPSLYEVFPLVVIEAAAAGLPIIVTKLNGVEDYLLDGISSIFVQRTQDSIADAIRALWEMGEEPRRRIGAQAQLAASNYTIEAFEGNWDRLLQSELSRRLNDRKGVSFQEEDSLAL